MTDGIPPTLKYSFKKKKKSTVSVPLSFDISCEASGANIAALWERTVREAIFTFKSYRLDLLQIFIV